MLLMRRRQYVLTSCFFHCSSELVSHLVRYGD
jgi:hypothetical protein